MPTMNTDMNTNTKMPAHDNDKCESESGLRRTTIAPMKTSHGPYDNDEGNRDEIGAWGVRL